MKSNRPGPKFTNWKEPGTATDPQHLRLGYLGQVIAIASEPLPNGTMCKQLPFSHFLQGAKFGWWMDTTVPFPATRKHWMLSSTRHPVIRPPFSKRLFQKIIPLRIKLLHGYKIWALRHFGS